MAIEPLSEAHISKEMRKKLSLQDYSPQERIEGVEIVELNYFTDDGGHFMELSRFVNERLKDFQDFEIKQMNYSEMEPGVVKAAHVHFKQEDIWFVPPADRLVVGLMDVREGSETEGVKMRFVMGGGKAKLLYIPRGVAHGAVNLSDKPAAILYYVNNTFDPDPENSDEHRLPWDSYGKDFWEMTKG